MPSRARACAASRSKRSGRAPISRQWRLGAARARHAEAGGRAEAQGDGQHGMRELLPRPKEHSAPPPRPGRAHHQPRVGRTAHLPARRLGCQLGQAPARLRRAAAARARGGGRWAALPRRLQLRRTHAAAATLRGVAQAARRARRVARKVRPDCALAFVRRWAAVLQARGAKTLPVLFCGGEQCGDRLFYRKSIRRPGSRRGAYLLWRAQWPRVPAARFRNLCRRAARRAQPERGGARDRGAAARARGRPAPVRGAACVAETSS
mmetsp:Transcript_5045/g.13069  ORF Transcript_5045/g.13069 Transcript_5045/m.13069 type:complete len:264 (+) Transcript_5045:495-1286(+)